MTDVVEVKTVQSVIEVIFESGNMEIIGDQKEIVEVVSAGPQGPSSGGSGITVSQVNEFDPGDLAQLFTSF